MAIDLSKVPAKKERRQSVRWSEETQIILADAVYKEMRDPEKDPTENILHILQRKIKELPPDDHRTINTLQQVPWLRSLLRRKIREEQKKLQEVYEKQKVTPEEKLNLINNYLENCPLEDLVAWVAKRQTIRSQQLEERAVGYLKEIQTQIHHNNSEVQKALSRISNHHR